MASEKKGFVPEDKNQDIDLWTQTILDNSPMGALILKAVREGGGTINDLVIQFANKKAEHLINISNLKGKRLIKDLKDYKLSGLINYFKEVIESGTSWKDEINFNHDGLEFRASVNAVKLDDGCHISFSEVAELNKKMNVLNNEANLLQTVFDNFPTYIEGFKAKRNNQNKIIDFTWILQNRQSKQKYGNLLNRRLLEVRPELHESEKFNRLARITETGMTENTELVEQHEGNITWFLETGVKLNDGVATTVTNITERKKKELKEIQQKEVQNTKSTDRFNALFNSIEQGYTTIHVKFDENDKPLDYQFLEISPSFEMQTGIKNAEGKWMRDIAADQDEFWFTIYGSVAATRKSERFEYFSTPLKRWWNVYAFPVDSPELRNIGVLFYDITLRKKTEKETEKLFIKIEHERAALKATMDSIPLAVLITNTDGKILQYNQQANNQWEKIGHRITRIEDYKYIEGWWPGTDKQLRVKDWPISRALLKKETVIEEEIEIRNPDGSITFYRHNAAPILDDKKNIIGSVAIEQDITERKRIELRFKADEEKKSYLLKLSDALQFLDDPNQIKSEAARILGEHLGANRTGYLEDTDDGKTFNVTCSYVNGVQELNDTYQYDKYSVELLQELNAGQIVTKENIINSPLLSEKKKEEYRQLQINATANKPLLKNGQLTGVLFVHYKDKHTWTNEELELMDETAERTWAAVEWARAESALRKSEINYMNRLEKEVKKRTSELVENKHFTQLITDTTPDIFFVYDIKKWKIIYVNKGITTTLGYAPQDVYASERKDFEQMLHPEDLRRRISEMAKLVNIKPGEVRESEFRIRDINGDSHWLNVRDIFFKADKNGKTTQVLSVCRDVTEQKEAIDAYQKERNRSEELKRMNELMDTFVFAAAHDLKAPVSNLQILTQVIEDTRDTDKKLLLQKKYARIIETLDLTISGLVKVLAVEKDSSSGIKTLNFRSIFNKVIAEMNDEITEINPEFDIDFSECKSINYIESYLFSIFRNILSNSLKFRSDKRKLNIVIHSGCKESTIWLSFSDNGMGINLDKYGNDLFKPFKRFSSKAEGSGLGLNLVKNIVTRNGGNIEVKGNKQGGTTFTVYLVPYKI